jgi:hypothetical protein
VIDAGTLDLHSAANRAFRISEIRIGSHKKVAWSAEVGATAHPDAPGAFGADPVEEFIEP